MEGFEMHFQPEVFSVLPLFFDKFLKFSKETEEIYISQDVRSCY